MAPAIALNGASHAREEEQGVAPYSLLPTPYFLLPTSYSLLLVRHFLQFVEPIEGVERGEAIDI